jgi:photosystem II stability/assembly factor-like uncharacterized protein
MMDYLIYGLAAFCAGADAADQLIFAARASGLYSASNVNGEWRKVCNPVETGLPPTATVVAIPPRSGETARYVFAGMQGGVLRTSNSGADWYYSPLSAPPPVISSIAISPNFTADAVVITGTLEDGVFRSEDHGRSWTPSNFGLLDLRVFSLVMSPHYMTDDTIFAGTESGVFSSTNGGRAWRETAFSMDAAPVLSLALSKSGVVYAGTEGNGLFASEDSGTSWLRRDQDAMNGAINQLTLLGDNHNEARILALHDDWIVASSDNGQTWDRWRGDAPAGITAFTTLDTNDESARLIVGLTDGQVQII